MSRWWLLDSPAMESFATGSSASSKTARQDRDGVETLRRTLRSCDPFPAEQIAVDHENCRFIEAEGTPGGALTLGPSRRQQISYYDLSFCDQGNFEGTLTKPLWIKLANKLISYMSVADVAFCLRQKWGKQSTTRRLIQQIYQASVRGGTADFFDANGDMPSA